MFTCNHEDIATGFSKVALVMSKQAPTSGPAKHLKKKSVPQDATETKTFDAKKGPPKISVLNYVKRIFHYGLELREELLPCFAAALVLMRLVACSLKLTSLNIHRVVALSFLVVTKHSTEYYGGDSHWADVLGIEKHELKQLEEQFYDIIDCNVEVSTEKVEEAMRDISAATGKKKATPTTTSAPVSELVSENEEESARSRAPSACGPPTPMRDSCYLSSCPSTDDDSPAPVAMPTTTPTRRKKTTGSHPIYTKEANTKDDEVEQKKEAKALPKRKKKPSSSVPYEEPVSCVKDAKPSPPSPPSPRRKKKPNHKKRDPCSASAREADLENPILGGTALGMLQQQNQAVLS